MTQQKPIKKWKLFHPKIKSWKLIHPKDKIKTIVLLILFCIASLIILLGTFSPTEYNSENLIGVAFSSFVALVYGFFGTCITNHSNNPGNPNPDKNINILPLLSGLIMGGLFFVIGSYIGFYYSSNEILMSWVPLHLLFGFELISIVLGVWLVPN